MRRLLLLMVAVSALAVPAAAVADGSSVKGGPKQATYVLEGVLSAYTAPAGPTDGSITIFVTKTNKAGQPFLAQSLTFPVSSSTKVKIKSKDGLIHDGARGKIQLKGAPALDATGLQALAPKQLDAKSNAPQPVKYELDGTLSAYTPASGAVNGSITILVSGGNAFSQSFVGQTLTFPVSSGTEVEVAGPGIADGDLGTVKVKGAPGLDAAGLQALVAGDVVDETA